MLKQEQIELIKTLYKQGLSKTEIARRVGCTYPTVSTYTKGIEQKDSMIGKKFNSLTVLEVAPKDPKLASRCLRYVCRCDCGNIVIVNGNSLRTNHTKSCGCERKGKNIRDLTGQRFGLLVTEKIVEVDDRRRAIWRCKCDCGQEVNVPSTELLGKHVTSCGCKKISLGEHKIKLLLEQMQINFIQQYRIKNCKYKNPLPFDFAIFDDDKLVALIEYQGDIHFIKTGGWNTEEELNKRQIRDKIKKEYCVNHNIKLIEIPYQDYDFIDEEYLRRKIYE